MIVYRVVKTNWDYRIFLKFVILKANNYKTKFLHLFICSLLSTEQYHSMWLPVASIISRAKPWTTPLYILGVKITKSPTNGGLQRVDIWMWSYVRLSLNDAKQPIVTNIQIWEDAGPNILRDHQSKIHFQEILNFLGSMRRRRVLNEHHFEGGVFPTYPRHQNIFQNFQVLRCVDFKAHFDEMRRYHHFHHLRRLQKPSQKRDFALHHRRNFWRIEGNYPSVVAICNLINNGLFSRQQKRGRVLLYLSDSSKALGIFHLWGLWSG